MKRTMMLTMLAFLMVLPSMAQYTRHSYGRPVNPYHRGYYESSYQRRPSAIDTYFGLRLGLGVATVNADNSSLDGGTPKTGLNVGVVAGIQLAPATPLYLETGLSYIEKGGKTSRSGSYTYGMNYLEVPFLVKYQHNFDRMTSLQPFAGVYGALGVSGQIKEQEKRTSVSAFSDSNYKRFDAGLRLGCGFQFDHLYAELGYDIGLANVSHDAYDTAHTGCFFANIGVNF